MKTETKSKIINLRLTNAEYIFLKCTADVYADGSISDWIRYCIKNYNPRYLNKGPSPIKKDGPRRKKNERR